MPHGTLLALLPFLRGWVGDAEEYYWFDLDCNPIRKGEPPKTVLRIEPQRGTFLYGIWAHVSSRFLSMWCEQRRGAQTYVRYGTRPLFLNQYNARQWTPFGCFLMTYSPADNVYAMAIVPDDPMPLAHPIEI